ncbi:nuclear transport factor 2 family protein [Chitinivorax sp. B]|uniref:nuclear transport factor 2 family protein n=1 Tax=Chitinivorax sp. B TaxID=2502235 RepID=UPI0014855453|nr:nuclear transport factor 2 family protein [Chitinivorax sp. B]
MNPSDQKILVKRYIDAYNQFDLEGMAAGLHQDIAFENVTGETVTAQAKGLAQFESLAKHGKTRFSQRQQTPTHRQHNHDLLAVGIDYRGVLAIDLPNGM